MEENTRSSKSIVAEIEISYTPAIKPSKRPKITSPEDAYALLMQTWDMSKMELAEQFKLILLNRSWRVLGICTVTTGITTGTLTCPRLVFGIALKANAIDIMIAHNHPSGNLVPSREDIRLTSNFKSAGQLLDIRVADHLIVTAEGFYSFAQEGTL